MRSFSLLIFITLFTGCGATVPPPTFPKMDLIKKEKFSLEGIRHPETNEKGYFLNSLEKEFWQTELIHRRSVGNSCITLTLPWQKK